MRVHHIRSGVDIHLDVCCICDEGPDADFEYISGESKFCNFKFY